jgi:hypothetical protein
MEENYSVNLLNSLTILGKDLQVHLPAVEEVQSVTHSNLSMKTRKRRKGFESKPTTSARAVRAWREILKAVLPSHFQDLISLVLSYCGASLLRGKILVFVEREK